MANSGYPITMDGKYYDSGVVIMATGNHGPSIEHLLDELERINKLISLNITYISEGKKDQESSDS